MEKIARYKEIVKKLVLEVADMTPDEEGVDNQAIIDMEGGHFLLFSVGWSGSQWIYSSFIHIDIRKNGKVWLQHDGTDLKIAEELVSRGIPKSDIVLGFQPPHARKLIEGYAVA